MLPPVPIINQSPIITEIDGVSLQVEVREFAATNQMSLDELGAWLSPVPPGSEGAPAHLEAPPVADLAVEVEVQLHHQEAVLGPGQARGAAAVRRRHVAGAVEVAEVVVSCGRAETVRLRPHEANVRQSGRRRKRENGKSAAISGQH